jgi:hypothetical protein
MFAIGDKEWPGVSKVLEEMGELQQVLGKIMGVRGETKHWSGDLRKMLLEELADLQAAIMFLTNHNLTEEEQEQIVERILFKTARFEAWHRDEYCFGCGAMAVPTDPCVCRKEHLLGQCPSPDTGCARCPDAG